MPLDTMETRRLTELQTKLALRDGRPGYKRNCAALRDEIAKLTLKAGPSGNPQESAAEVSP